MRNQYVTLNLENLSKVKVLQHPVRQHKNLWRAWRQLSRLQKNLILMIFIFTSVGIYYWLFWSLTNINEPSLDTEKNPNDNVMGQQHLDNKGQVDLVLPDLNKIPLDEEKKHKLGMTFGNPKGVRQKEIVRAMKHAWNGYRKYAWGHDHLKPISKSYQDWFYLGLSIVDSLDTLYMMNLYDEFSEAREWISNSFSTSHYKDVNLFEVTIRVLGGLLSAHHLSEDVVFLDKAIDIGDKLLPCFTKSPTNIPYSDINLATKFPHAPQWSPDSSTAEVTTLQLEFRDLSRCSGDSKYEKAAFGVTEHIHKLSKPDGLVPIFINPNTGRFHAASEIKLGARGDSYYEYLLKQWIQTGKSIDFLKNDYMEAIDGIINKLVKTTVKRKLVFIGELKSGTHEFSPKMDHLTCYLPGTLALGVYYGMPESHMRLAEQLIRTCYYMYADQPTFLTPEIVYFNYEDDEKPDMIVHHNDAHNLLRPEFIESLWYMYSITGNETYQNWGWTIFQAMERYSKVEAGYTSIGTVLDPTNTRPRDMMESFFLSETLKYFYLLFSSDRNYLDIDKFVVNSEGHPLPIYSN